MLTNRYNFTDSGKVGLNRYNILYSCALYVCYTHNEPFVRTRLVKGDQ